MKLLKRIFRKTFCENCRFRDSYYKYESLKQKLKVDEKKMTEIETTQAEFLKKIKAILPKDEVILFISVDIDSPLTMITLRSEYDVYGRIDKFTFRGYTSEYLKNPNSYFRKEEIYVETRYKKVSDYDSIEYLHHFYIVDVCCTPNKGYGSMLMNSMINYLSQFKLKNKDIYILGWLSPVDKSTHNERLHHFYEKFDFDFTWNEKGEEFVIKYL